MDRVKPNLRNIFLLFQLWICDAVARGFLMVLRLVIPVGLLARCGIHFANGIVDALLLAVF